MANTLTGSGHLPGEDLDWIGFFMAKQTQGLLSSALTNKAFLLHEENLVFRKQEEKKCKRTWARPVPVFKDGSVMDDAGSGKETQVLGIDTHTTAVFPCSWYSSTLLLTIL